MASFFYLMRHPRTASLVVLKKCKIYWSWLRLWQLGVIRSFKGYPPEALRPKYNELFWLYRLVLARRPAVIVELGGGYSTIALVHAARDLSAAGHETIVHSYDGSDYWQGVVKDHMPDSLKPFVQFHRCDAFATKMAGEDVSLVRNLPDKKPNLLFIDGCKVPGTQIGADAVQLEPDAPADYAVLVDGREKTVAFLRANLKRQYQVGAAPGTKKQTLFEPISRERIG